MSEFQKDELSLEETNKLRVQLGLKPLAPDSDDEGEATIGSKGLHINSEDNDDDDDPLKNQDEKAAKNYAAYQDSMRRKRDEDETRERIAKAQNRRELNRKLQGHTLGDVEGRAKGSDAGAAAGGDGGDAVDAKKWLRAQRKRAKENEARFQREEREAEAAQASARSTYDTDDLRGLRVGHDVDEFELAQGGEARVLTLRDSKILDNEDDELMDSALEQAERDRILSERKRGVKKYTGLDDDEFEIGNVGRSRGVLSKYDGDIEMDGIVRDGDAGFRLGGAVQSRLERKEDKQRGSDRMLNRTLLNLDYTKNEDVSDYLKEGDTGFKKPKTKKKRQRAPARVSLEADEDDIGNRNVNGHAPATGEDTQTSGAGPSAIHTSQRALNDTSNLVDDDDLAISLAKARRKQARKTYQKITPETIARNLAAQRAADEEENRIATAHSPKLEGSEESVQMPGNGLTFDDTSEFVRIIQSARDASPDKGRQGADRRTEKAFVKEEPAPSPQAPSPSHDDDVVDAFDAEQLLVRNAKEEESDDAMEEDAIDDNGEPPFDGAKAGDEPNIGGGLAATLSILRSQGQFAGLTPEQRAREEQQNAHDAWLAKRRMEDRMREAELAASKAQGSAKDQATREYENRKRELEDARRAQERFKEYKPDIDIKYHDEHGRELTSHETWKQLSHTFHHKMPGKKKQEKRLQKIESERQRDRMLAGDTPTGMSKAFAERAERSGQAYMVLGVGARNNAPQDAALLGPNTVALGGDDGLDKGKARRLIAVSPGEEGQEGRNQFIAGAANGDLHLGQEADLAGVTSMVPRSTATKVKAGFAPIQRTAATSPQASTASVDSPPLPASKFKVAFAAKRPAPTNGAIALSPGKQARFT